MKAKTAPTRLSINKI